MKALFAVLALIVLGAARDPILVPEISEHEVRVSHGFTGAELLLFGAILTPEGQRAGRDYDIVVVMKGPTRSIVLREKQKIGGIWINAKSAEFRSAPSFYALASSRPIRDIVDDKTAAIYELGLGWLQLSPIGVIEPKEQARFAAGLVDLNRRKGLYGSSQNGVTIREQVLYQARITLPSSVQTGIYTADVFAITRGRVVASASNQVRVEKEGFDRVVADFAQNDAFLYGLLVVVMSVAMGIAAGRLFRKP